MKKILLYSVLMFIGFLAFTMVSLCLCGFNTGEILSDWCSCILIIGLSMGLSLIFGATINL